MRPSASYRLLERSRRVPGSPSAKTWWPGCCRWAGQVMNLPRRLIEQVSSNASASAFLTTWRMSALCSSTTVATTRSRSIASNRGGLIRGPRIVLSALAPGPRSANSTRKRIFDGAAEAKLIALACSPPPKGRKRWTLTLLETAEVSAGQEGRIRSHTDALEFGRPHVAPKLPHAEAL
jgi:hypothetical protein